jgi:hypothetical protein
MTEDERCRHPDCIYRNRSDPDKSGNCNYMVIEGRSRTAGLPERLRLPANCPHYKPDGTTPMFLRTIDQHERIPDGYKLYRRLLSQQPDHSVSIVSIGFVASLAQLLQSEADEYSALSGAALVRQKVKCIYLQGGVFGNAEEPDYNFAQGITFAQTFFELWPKDVDMVFSPMEVGQDVEYTPEQVIADVSWTDRHPIKQVYMTCNCNTGQRMWDAMCVIQAVEGDELFTLSERGIVTLTPIAGTIFTPSATGNDRYQMPGTEAWCQAMLEKIREYLRKRTIGKGL